MHLKTVDRDFMNQKRVAVSVNRSRWRRGHCDGLDKSIYFSDTSNNRVATNYQQRLNKYTNGPERDEE